jgi:hypothetical protein
MNNPSTDTRVLPTWMRAWEDFWFTPADPSLLGLIRICCGMIVAYTLIAYSFKLQDFMGEHAWHDLEMRLPIVRERPVTVLPLNWSAAGRLPEPKNEFERKYKADYRKDWGFPPPPPYPTNDDQVKWLDEFRKNFHVDARQNGAPIPKDDFEIQYALEYTQVTGMPPPGYPATLEEANEIKAYLQKWGVDPRRTYTKGMTVWSVWFHVTDPSTMVVVHTLFIVAALLFTVGFCTRITSVATWFALLCYIQRNPVILFGVDTMMTIVLTYLMLAPCGAVYSVDRLLLNWWRRAKPGMVQGWYRFWRLPVPSVAEVAPALEPPTASVSANVAIRLLQIHVGVVYLFSGTSKLLGPAWWNGTAVWGTLGNFEFAPMQYEPYLAFLRFLGDHQWLYDGFMTASGLFTLAFEVSYIFLVWRPRLRWVYLGSAILLHGGIGLFMGLKTFSLMMLVMNMAFLRKEEVAWLLGGFLQGRRTAPTAAPAPTVETSATAS